VNVERQRRFGDLAAMIGVQVEELSARMRQASGVGDSLGQELLVP
jgi:hypothetical protein